jgi:hypothetical protein
MIYFLVAVVFFIIGNMAPKIRVEGLSKRKSENKAIHRTIPPPPRMITPIKEGHIKPGITYSSDTFVNVNECRDCGAVAREHDMFSLSPCPKCGGRVKPSGAAKWGVMDGEKQWVRPVHQQNG